MMRIHPTLPACLLAASVMATPAIADAPLPTEFINVGSFIGDASERIEEAMAAAAATDHKTVYFPNGTYALRRGIGLNQGLDTEIHLIGESEDGVLLVPDVTYLENNPGSSVTHMIGLGNSSVFNTVDVSIQNMTLDMRHPEIVGVPSTYNVAGHGIRIGQGWQDGQFTVNEVTIRNTSFYGIGIQDRGGHPKNNVTLTNLHIERTGSDAIDTKEASGDGNRNLVIRNLSVNEIGFRDGGPSNAIDVRYRDGVIENVNLVSQSTNSTLEGRTSTTTGINFRPFEAGYAGIVGYDVSDIYVRGFNTGMILSSNSNATHQDIAISDFYVEGHSGSAIGSSGSNHSGHTISDGFVNPDFGNPVNVGTNATVTNVVDSRRDPALTPTTHTTFESNVSIVGETFSPVWEGVVGAERVSLNPTAGPGPFVFNISDTAVMQIDFDSTFNAMDRLIVDGTLNLGGELRINPVNGLPTQGGIYKVFEADTITGSFANISLPSIPGSAWITDTLVTQGTVSLLFAQSSTIGDSNTSHNPSDPNDNPYVNPTFLAEVQAQWPSYTLKGLDQFGNSSIRAMTFQFTPPDTNALDSVWLEISLNPLAGYGSDQLVLESLDRIIGLNNLDGFDGTSSDPQILRYEFQASEFALLADGELSIALQDDTIVDWVTISWLEGAPQVPTPGTFATLGAAASVLFSRR